MTDAVYGLVQIVNGLQLGLLLFLMAAGLSLILGAMGVVNLAHGALYMLGGYLGYSLVGLTGSFILALLLLIPVALLLGLLLERLFIRQTYGRHPLEQVLLCLGLFLVIEEVRSAIWGDEILSLPIPDWLAGSLPIGEALVYPHYRIAIVGLCLLLMVGLYWLIHRTPFGSRIRALSENRRMLASLGISPNHLTSAVFAVGTLLAMTAGLLAAPLTTLYPHLSAPALISSLVVVILGGLGSMLGTLFAAILVGLVQTLGQLWAGDLAGLSIYLAMALVLAFRPAGLAGR